MPAGKFHLNKKTVREILMTVDGGKREAAQQILSAMGDPEGRLEVYYTDREAVGVMIPADTQAKYGTATRAANKQRNR
jgi:hypothetical protein